MSTINEIKSAIAALSMEERAELIAELCGWVDDEWDEQMKRDSAAGKFKQLNREAEGAKAKPLEEILGDS